MKLLLLFIIKLLLFLVSKELFKLFNKFVVWLWIPIFPLKLLLFKLLFVLIWYWFKFSLFLWKLFISWLFNSSSLSLSSHIFNDNKYISLSLLSSSSSDFWSLYWFLLSFFPTKCCIFSAKDILLFKPSYFLFILFGLLLFFWFPLLNIVLGLKLKVCSLFPIKGLCLALSPPLFNSGE